MCIKPQALSAHRAPLLRPTFRCVAAITGMISAIVPM